MFGVPCLDHVRTSRRLFQCSVSVSALEDDRDNSTVKTFELHEERGLVRPLMRYNHVHGYSFLRITNEVI
jgi:hypothetical protein